MVRKFRAFIQESVTVLPVVCYVSLSWVGWIQSTVYFHIFIRSASVFSSFLDISFAYYQILQQRLYVHFSFLIHAAVHAHLKVYKQMTLIIISTLSRTNKWNKLPSLIIRFTLNFSAFGKTYKKMKISVISSLTLPIHKLWFFI